MHPHRKKALLAALGALLFGAATGRVLLDSMNDSALPALAVLAGAADPEPGAQREAADAVAYRLVLVVLDGLGEAPFSAAIEKTDLKTYDFRATVDVGSPSLSRPVYHVILTGVRQSVSGIRSNAHAGRARADDLCSRVREAGGSVAWALETVPWFHDLFALPEDIYWRGDVPASSAVSGGLAGAPPPQRHGFAAMERVLEQNPALAVLHFTAIDHAGHDHGAASEEYRNAADEAVSAVARLREAYARTPEGARTVWMLGADHGHLPAGGHGGPETEVRRTEWIGLWPAPVQSPVNIAGVVPAERLAATFAAILGVPPPREALGEPLELPDRKVHPSPAMKARGKAVDAVLAELTQAAQRAVAARAVALLALLGALAALLIRRGKGRALAGAALPALLAVVAFCLLGPGLTLSAIRTHFYFLARSIAAMAVGAALAYSIALRFGAAPRWVFIAAAFFPAAAYAVAGGSMGHSMLPEATWLLLPATGLVPCGVVAGVLVAQSVQTLARRLRNS